MNASVHGEIVNIWYHSYVHQYTKVHISEPLMIQDVLSIKKNPPFYLSQISESIVLSIGTQVKKNSLNSAEQVYNMENNMLFTMLFTFIKPQLFLTMLRNTPVVEKHLIFN